MIGQMAITIALPGFNNLVWWPHFSSLVFLRLARKWRKCLIRSFNFLQNTPSNSLLFRSLFICVAVSIASWLGLGFVKLLATFMQQTHFYKIWLRLFASVDSPLIFLTINLCEPCWITCASFSKSGSISETKSLWSRYFLHSWHK